MYIYDKINNYHHLSHIFWHPGCNQRPPIPPSPLVYATLWVCVERGGGCLWKPTSVRPVALAASLASAILCAQSIAVCTWICVRKVQFNSEAGRATETVDRQRQQSSEQRKRLKLATHRWACHSNISCFFTNEYLCGKSAGLAKLTHDAPWTTAHTDDIK